VRVPLGAEYDALGIIARACRSRLFGYFFAVPSSRESTHDELRGRKPQDAVAALLFGGRAIEQARWPIVATSLAFDPQAWPFPAFASRGAFGDAWTQVRYDADTMQIVERLAIDAQAAAMLPDARFATAEDAEALLRRAIAGEPAPHAHSIVEVRTPIDAARLRTLERGGRIQFSTSLPAADLDRLAHFIDVHPHVALRVHGFRHGFDCTHLARFAALRELALDAHVLQHPAALRELRSLRILRIGPARTHLAFLDALGSLQTLELRGTRTSLEPVLHLPALQTLVLEDTQALDLRALQCANELRTLVLSHGECDVRALRELPNLRRLELRSLDTHVLPPLHELRNLEELELHGLAHVADLARIADAPALHTLRIGGMPQLNVEHFRPLQRCGGLRRFDVSIGSRTKEREIYRLLKRGNM
jgi:hypothetical protein